VIQQLHWIYLQPITNPLDSLKREVSLSAFQPTDVGAMPAEHLGESLLGETPFFAVPPEVLSDSSLQIPLGHPWNVPEPLLDGLQTYK
jgi:hypothetical protein